MTRLFRTFPRDRSNFPRFIYSVLLTYGCSPALNPNSPQMQHPVLPSVYEPGKSPTQLRPNRVCRFSDTNLATRGKLRGPQSPCSSHGHLIGAANPSLVARWKTFLKKPSKLFAFTTRQSQRSPRGPRTSGEVRSFAEFARSGSTAHPARRGSRAVDREVRGKLRGPEAGARLKGKKFFSGTGWRR